MGLFWDALRQELLVCFLGPDGAEMVPIGRRRHTCSSTCCQVPPPPDPAIMLSQPSFLLSFFFLFLFAASLLFNPSSTFFFFFIVLRFRRPALLWRTGHRALRDPGGSFRAAPSPPCLRPSVPHLSVWESPPPGRSWTQEPASNPRPDRLVPACVCLEGRPRLQWGGFSPPLTRLVWSVGCVWRGTAASLPALIFLCFDLGES